MVKVPAVPSPKDDEAALVMVGAASTMRLNDWMAALPMPFAAVMVSG